MKNTFNRHMVFLSVAAVFTASCFFSRSNRPGVGYTALDVTVDPPEIRARKEDASRRVDDIGMPREDEYTSVQHEQNRFQSGSISLLSYMMEEEENRRKKRENRRKRSGIPQSALNAGYKPFDPTRG